MNESAVMFSQLYAGVEKVGAVGCPVDGQVEVAYQTREPHTTDIILHATDDAFRTVTRVVSHEPGLPVRATITQVTEFGGIVDTRFGLVMQAVDPGDDPAANYAALLEAAQLQPGSPERAAHMVLDMLVDVQAFVPNETD